MVEHHSAPADGEGAGRSLLHDLSSPLRAIALYAELMETALATEAVDVDQLGHYRMRIAESAEEARLLLARLADGLRKQR